MALMIDSPLLASFDSEIRSGLLTRGAALRSLAGPRLDVPVSQTH
jgi:hypothetical protein